MVGVTSQNCPGIGNHLQVVRQTWKVKDLILNLSIGQKWTLERVLWSSASCSQVSSVSQGQRSPVEVQMMVSRWDAQGERWSSNGHLLEGCSTGRKAASGWQGSLAGTFLEEHLGLLFSIFPKPKGNPRLSCLLLSQGSTI